jgi:asparagine synthase (glutamine-hydrolysing)
MSVDQPVSFAHIDCDWYDSVITCLNQIEPRLSPGGILVIDDYLDWSGCHKAIEAYFERKKDQYDFIFKTRLHIRKKK